jgi:MFS transporter, DHA1 family, multidrug resistance protein
MGFPEFVVVIASIMALNPLAMDMMLPALPDIASAFHITTANQPQEVLSAFLIGFGVGQFIMGPLSDRFGRRPVLIDGMALYCIASVLAITASSFETLLLARVPQGLGTSATRVIATSIVRDCYAGRRMASVMSLAMMVFIAVPVIAPSLGQAVMLLTQWRGIFIVLMLYGVLALIWSGLRMPETLPVAERKSLAVRDVLGAFRQTVTNRQTLGYALAAGSVQGSLFAFVFSSQQAFTEIYRLGHYFPLAFAAVAIGVAVAGFLNARIVGRVGMRIISHGALTGFVAVAGMMLIAVKTQTLSLALFIALTALMMFAFGLMFANFTSLAMEPQGHIAGTASSLYGSITTLLGIGIGTTIGQDYDGTLLPFATGFFLCALASLAIVLVVEKGRLFKPRLRGITMLER